MSSMLMRNRIVFVIVGVLAATVMLMVFSSPATIASEGQKEIQYLDHNLTVGPGEVLTLEDVEIRIIGQNGIIVDGGSFDINNTTITSWDNARQQPILQPHGRGFIFVIDPDNDTSITNSKLEYLGNQIAGDSRYNGLVYYESKEPVSYHLITKNVMHHMFDGFYSRAAQNMEISHNIVYNNTRYGLDPHSSTDDVLISQNEVFNNGAVGIICSENCSNITISDNLVHGNGKKKAGIMLSLNTNDSIVESNIVFHENTGISIVGSHNNTIKHNYIEDISNGIEVKFGSTHNRVYDNMIQFYYGYGISVGANATDNSIEVPAISTGISDVAEDMLFVKHEVKNLNAITNATGEKPSWGELFPN